MLLGSAPDFAFDCPSLRSFPTSALLGKKTADLDNDTQITVAKSRWTDGERFSPQVELDVNKLADRRERSSIPEEPSRVTIFLRQDRQKSQEIFFRAVFGADVHKEMSAPLPYILFIQV